MENILYLHAGAELYGADIVLYELLKGLDKNKYKVHLILPEDGPLVYKMKEIDIDISVIDYPILRRKYFTPIGIINYFKEYIVKSKKIIEYCKNNNIDIIHTNTMAVLLGVWIKRKLRLKHVWHIHEIIKKPALINKILSIIASKSADKIITVSNAVKNHLLDVARFKKDQIKVIYNGVDNKKFNPSNESDYIKKEYGIKNNEVAIGTIGRINAWKGQKDFLLAMENVLKKHKNAKAIIVGGVFAGEEYRIDQLKEQINESVYSDRIILDGYREDTKNLYCAFDVFVLPSTLPDPLPTVVLEAMASGKPIVSYRHGGACEMVKENYNGVFAEIGNTQDLSDKIDILVSDEGKRRTFGQNSHKRQKEEFSLESYIRNFEKVYDTL